ncbi:MAG: DUF4919 domain-containing protein [Deltaproteobacteria bacterium]|nr:DUF4919 domain-containing protein [Deltaproteobacteria bacterium]
MRVTREAVFFLCLCLVFWGCAAVGTNGASKVLSLTPKKTYEEHVSGLKSGNTEINYFDFRISYTRTAFYNPYKMKNVEVDAAFLAKERGEYDKVLETANAIFEYDYTDMDAHYLASVAYREKGDEKNFRFHTRVFNGLVDSITASGDGLTKDTAMIVINAHEEYVWLGVNGFRRGRVAGMAHKGSMLDELMCIHKDSGEHKTFYFNVDLPEAYLKRKSGN